MSTPELCVCGHSYWDHDDGQPCEGDFGSCGCMEFQWIGPEEDDDGER